MKKETREMKIIVKINEKGQSIIIILLIRVILVLSIRISICNGL